MEADLNASLQLVVGGFLSTGFTTDTLAWIFFLFIEDDNDEDDQRHKTCLARESLPAAWMTERVLNQVKS